MREDCQKDGSGAFPAPPASSDTKARDLAECIVAVARVRDRTAFATLFTHFAPRVKAYLRRHGASATAAEDLAQETLLAVWHKAASFDPARASAATWVFTIARNLRIDALRHERYPATLAHDPEPAGDHHDAGIAQAERQRLVAQALADLPIEQAEVIRLAFFEDRSHTEIERRLGLPLGTIKSRLRSAMRRLRQALGQQA